MNELINAEVYTDGSCHTQHCIGAWASILFIGNDKITLPWGAASATKWEDGWAVLRWRTMAAISV